MQSTATGPVPAAPARAGRPQVVSCLSRRLDRIAREPGPAFPGSGSPRLDSLGVSAGEGLKPSPAASPLFFPPSFRPGAAPPTPSFRPKPWIHPGRSGEIFQPRRRVRSTALERFLHSAPRGAPVEMTGRGRSLHSAPHGAPVEMTERGRSLHSAPCGAPDAASRLKDLGLIYPTMRCRVSGRRRGQSGGHERPPHPHPHRPRISSGATSPSEEGEGKWRLSFCSGLFLPPPLQRGRSARVTRAGWGWRGASRAPQPPSPSFRPSVAPPTPSFRPEPWIHPGRSGEIFQPRRRVRSTALERFLHSAPHGAPVEMTERGRSLHSAPCGAPVEMTGGGRSLRAVRGGAARVTG